MTIATLPTSLGKGFCNKGGKFGPPNLHENRPGSLQTEELIFATCRNAGVRVFDVSNAYAPKEIAWSIPRRRNGWSIRAPAPNRWYNQQAFLLPPTARCSSASK